MTDVPIRKPSLRQRIHVRVCRDPRCVLETSDPGDACRSLDHLLDLSDELLLHTKADELRTEAERVGRQRHGVPVAGGVLRAADLTDPYILFDTFDPEMDDEPHGLAKHPDCPGCINGFEHYHRKSDGSRVRSIT